MTVLLALICAASLSIAVTIWVIRARGLARLEEHSLTAHELHSLLASNVTLQVFDVRQPLDLLAYPEIIPGARRVPPEEVLDRPTLIPKDVDTVVYCTCPSDKTSRMILRRALELKFFRMKFLKGGLAGWKSCGYPVEPYSEVFHPHTASMKTRAGL